MKDSVDMFLVGESLSAGVAAGRGMVDGFSPTIDLRDPLSSMSFIDSSECLHSFLLCLSPVSAILIELLRDFEDRPRGLSSPPWNGEPVWGSSYWELQCRLVVLLWGRGLRCDPYGFVPVYDGRIFRGGSVSWVFSLGKVGRVGDVEIIPDEVELGGRADVDVVKVVSGWADQGIPRTAAGRLLGNWGACWTCCPQAESNEVSGQVCGSGVV